MKSKNIERKKHFRGFSLFNVLVISAIADVMAVVLIFGLF